MTREQVQDLLAMVQAAYPNYNPPSKTAAVNAWTMALEEYNADEVAIAFKMYMKTNASGFAPAPGQLIEKIHTIKQPQELNEMEAWALVSKAIRNSTYNSVEEYAKLPRLVQKVVGLPSQLRTWAMDKDYNEQVVLSNFIKCYRTEVLRRNEFEKLPSDVQRLIRSVSVGSPAVQMDAKRDLEIKSFVENKNALEAKIDGIPMPESVRRRMEEMRE